MGHIPASPVKPSNTLANPILIYGMPKVGKTAGFAKLEDNIILDFEKSTRRVECYKVDIDSVKKYYEVINELKEDTKFKYITLDTITSMEKIAKDFAEFLYSKTSFGANWYKEHKAKYVDITNIPMGLGHTFLKNAYIDMLTAAINTGKRIIIVGHVKDSYKEENGIQIQFNDLDLHGPTKRALLSKYLDGYGYIYRLKENTNIITFIPTENINAGSRGELGKYKDVFSVLNENNELEVNFKFLEY